MSRQLAVIDGNSLMHRAYHAVPNFMTAPDGRPTNAIFGFVSMLIKLVESLKPDGVIVAFDLGIPEFRFQAVEQYKAQRPPTDEELKTQFPMIKALLEALQIPVVELPGWEGDDILGSLAAEAKLVGVQCMLVTGDKDALQLVDDNTTVVNTRSGMSDVIVYDRAAVIERWGIPPELVTDFLGLMGDSSDNIPGVPGVGEKRAQALLTEYGTLDEVLANAGSIPGKLGENLRNNADLALASRVAATISRDVPIDCDVQAVRFPSYNASQLTAAFREFALTSQLPKMLKFIEQAQAENKPDEESQSTELPDDLATSPASQENNVDKTSIADMQAQTAVASAYPALESLPGNIPNQPLSYLSGAEARQSLQGYLQKGSVFSLVIEDSPGQASFFDTNETELYCLVEDKLLNLGEILSTETSTALAELYCQAELLIAFDHKALLGYLMPRDTTVAAAIDYAEVDPTRLFDCSLAAYLIDSTMVPGSLRALLERYPALADEAAEVQEQLAALPRLAAQMLQQLIADNALECYETIEKPLIAVLAQMERTGVRIDREMLAALNRTVTADLEDLRREAIEAAGEEFNLDSPKQLGVILFEKLKLPTAKKTRTGYSTDASVLEDLKPLHALPGLMLAYRELAKLKSTYLDALPRLVKADGKIHTTFNQTVTATGRLSSTDPNLQNIPVRTELGRQIRLAFVPDGASFAGVAGMGAGAAVALAAVAPGAAPAAAPAAVAPAAAASVKPLSHTAVPREAVLLGADYSQIELRILAHCSEDPGLVQSFIAGEDFHTMTASQVWSVDPADVTPELRNRAKAVNFGIVYGQQAYGLAQSLGVPYQDAQFLINRYFATFPGVRDYLDKTVAIARSQGWVETIFGRRRYLKDLFSSNASRRSFADRTAMNHPMQGSAADIIKLAMVEVMNRIVADGYAAELLLQVHDELMFNCAADEAASLGEMVKQTMEAACELKVPLVADINVGSNWAEAH